MPKEHTYIVKGIHCASCEILVENKLSELPNIKSAKASVAKSEVRIKYENQEPSIKELNRLFEKEKYIFSEKNEKNSNASISKDILSSIVVAGLIILLFLVLNKTGLTRLVNVNSASSLPTFFLFGVLAGISSCAALVGGIVLSMSKQWLEIYPKEDSTLTKLQPHLMFNFGRILSFFILGGVLGLIGQRLQLSLRFGSILIVLVSFFMIFLALQMLGLKFFRRFQFGIPKFASRYISNPANFNGRSMPALLGAATFFLPCGFTITAQSLALLSGSFWQGGLTMFLFALGTLPGLLAIGFSSVKLSVSRWSNQFLKIAGVLVLFFGLYNINAQLNVLGFTGFSNLNSKAPVSQNKNVSPNDLAEIVGGEQILKMEASSAGYKPNYFKVKAGVPVKWEITDAGTSGCTSAVISPNLFSGQIKLTPGQTSVKEFTPEKPGKYRFSCWMGMVAGTIEVVTFN